MCQVRKSPRRDLAVAALREQGFVVLDADANIRFANEWAPRLFDLPADAFAQGTPFADVVARGYAPDAAWAPAEPQSGEIATRAGRLLFASFLAMPEGGTLASFAEIPAALDDGEDAPGHSIEAANARIRALVSNLEAVIEHIDYGIAFTDRDLNADIVNPAFREMWGIDKAFADSRPSMREMLEYNRHSGLYDVEGEDWDAYVEQRVRAARNGAIPPSEMQRKDGRVLRYECVALPDGRRMMTYYDVTEVKRGELEMRRHAEALQVIQDAIDHGLTWFDEDLKLRAWNRKVRELLDFPEEKFGIGDSLEAFFRYNALRGEYGDGDPGVQVAERMALARRFEPHTFERTRADGTIIQVQGFVVPQGGFVTTYTDVTEKRRSERQIEFLAHHDVLTKLPNRLMFTERLAQAMANARADGGRCAVLCFDLDDFKDVNDTLGHGVGDRLLQDVAARVGEALGDAGTLCRLGGDEFAVILDPLRAQSEAAARAEHIVDAMARPFRPDGHDVLIGASVGIAVYSPAQSEQDPHQLLRNADLALYSVKRAGGHGFQFFADELSNRMSARKELERDLRHALDNREFRVFYQPLVNAGDRRVIGFEALLRWQHPARGLLAPAEFIGLAEETGLICEIGAFVLATACRDLLAHAPLKLAVNLSPVQFRRSDVASVVADVLRETGFEPGRLELEITENVMLLDTAETLATLARLKTLGISIALDDFGIGYSSLSYLHSFKFDKLKVDRNFVANYGHNAETNAIVQSMIGLGKTLGMRANAEGVETNLQADLLRLEGCDELQGYFFGRPMPIGDALGLLVGRDRERPDDDLEKPPAIHPIRARAQAR